MLVLLIVPVWLIGLALVAALCTAARIGDSDLLEIAETERGEARARATFTARRVGPSTVERSASAPLTRELAA